MTRVIKESPTTAVGQTPSHPTLTCDPKPITPVRGSIPAGPRVPALHHDVPTGYGPAKPVLAIPGVRREEREADHSPSPTAKLEV